MKKVLEKLEALRTKDEALRVFGANGHGYKLAPKLAEAEVASVEKQFGVKLPEDYRTFLLEIGSGGAGPGYGLFRLIRRGRTWGWEGDGGDLTGDLREPFPHAKKWNISFEPWDEDQESEDDYWARRGAWDDEVYWHPKQTTGAICICHEGCAIRDWLVVTGKERGRIWLDDRASDAGLVPREVTFGDWYMKWLESAVRSAAAKR